MMTSAENYGGYVKVDIKMLLRWVYYGSPRTIIKDQGFDPKFFAPYPSGWIDPRIRRLRNNERRNQRAKCSKNLPLNKVASSK